MAKKIIKKAISFRKIALVTGMSIIIALSFVFDTGNTVQADTILPSVTVGNAAPSLSGVVLKMGSNSTPIVLTENTTTSVVVVGLITDNNGDADITSATATIYMTSVASAELCSASDINCYPITSGNCTLESTDGDNDRNVTCTTALWFLADRTDDDSETWTGFISATDGTDYGTGTATEEVNTLSALDVTASIGYGTLSTGATTSIASQVTVQVTTTGNLAIDVQLQATSSDSGGSGGMTNADFSQNIPVDQQQVTTNSNKEYQDGAETDAEVFDLSSTTALSFELESATPTTHTGNTSDEADDTFWKIGIPSGQPADTYNGTTTATAVGD